MARVLAMRVAVGDERATMMVAIARAFDVPIGLVMSARDLRVERRSRR